MKIALVHDDLIQFGGGERLLLAMSEVFPDAPIYTSVYNHRLALSTKRFAHLDIRTSFMQKLPFNRKLRRIYFPLYPFAFESFDLSDFDIVISSSTRFAHGVITKPKTLHICYLNSPPRFLWNENEYFKKENLGNVFQILLQPMLSYLRIWDQTVAKSRVDYFIANSKNVAEKIKKIYQREAEVIYPFVDLEKFKPKNPKPYPLNPNPYYLIVSRLLSWKRIDIAIDCANQLKLNLKIAGSGPDLNRLKKIAGSTVEFLGQVDDLKLIELYQQAQAVIITQEEDFGLVSLEAQACGVPVIAYLRGGALETVIDGKTGLFFAPQTKNSLANAIKKFENMTFDKQVITSNAQKFSKQNFQNQLKLYIEKLWHKKKMH